MALYALVAKLIFYCNGASTFLRVLPVSLIAQRPQWLQEQFHNQFKLNNICAATGRVGPACPTCQLTNLSILMPAATPVWPTRSRAKQLISLKIISFLLHWFWAQLRLTQHYLLGWFLLRHVLSKPAIRKAEFKIHLNICFQRSVCDIKTVKKDNVLLFMLK